MKKQLDTTVMENELRSGSAFFRAVPQRQDQAEEAHSIPPPTAQEDFGSNTATPSLSSPLDGLPAIKPPKKEANLAPVMPLKHLPTDQPPPSPPLIETPRQMGGESARQTDGQSDDPGTLPSLSPTPPLREETKERINERTNEVSNVKRQKIRHTFDIYADQLLSLKEIQLRRARVFEEVYRLGDLVQEALDGFITKERNKE